MIKCTSSQETFIFTQEQCKRLVWVKKASIFPIQYESALKTIFVRKRLLRRGTRGGRVGAERIRWNAFLLSSFLLFLFPTKSYVGDFLCCSLSWTVKYIAISGKSNKSKNAGFCICSNCVFEGLSPPQDYSIYDRLRNATFLFALHSEKNWAVKGKMECKEGHKFEKYL